MKNRLILILWFSLQFLIYSQEFKNENTSTNLSANTTLELKVVNNYPQYLENIVLTKLLIKENTTNIDVVNDAIKTQFIRTFLLYGGDIFLEHTNNSINNKIEVSVDISYSYFYKLQSNINFASTLITIIMINESTKEILSSTVFNSPEIRGISKEHAISNVASVTVFQSAKKLFELCYLKINK